MKEKKMELNWRSAFRQFAEEYYVQRGQEWFDWSFSPSHTVDITIVSERFAGVAPQQRKEQIEELLQQFHAPVTTGFLSLHTLREARDLHLVRPTTTEQKPAYNWFDLAHQAENLSEKPFRSQREPRIPRTVTFYSFKGGVGRTTALTHVAATLAIRGRTVVAVDLDLEAPGLSSALRLTPQPEYGIVDYFYERAYIGDGEDIVPDIAISQIFGEVSLPDAPGRLFVVPAGNLTSEYVAKVDDLHSTVISQKGETLWATFYKEITEQLQPDVILVDSRTGINDWGAFSLLRAADKAVIFLFPDEQNRQGIELLVELLAGQISTSFVFSPVPTIGGVGQEVVKRQWAAMYPHLHKTNGSSPLENKVPEPIIIPYNTEVALADNYPVFELLSLYRPIANLIDEDTTAIRINALLSKDELRREILEDLHFPQLDASKDGSIYTLFQRTADFDKTFDERTCVIRGLHHTGKSTLYWLLLKHKGDVDDLTYGRFKKVRYVSGHGPLSSGPSAQDFQQLDRDITLNREGWNIFWQYYLLWRLYTEGFLEQQLKEDKFHSITRSLGEFSKVKDQQWSQEHNTILLNRVGMNLKVDVLAQDMLAAVDEQLQKKNLEYWVLYDDLDLDVPKNIREKVLTGLLLFVQATKFKNIRFKIFLREDIWQSLNFTSKKNFFGRDVLLSWTHTDFLRLTLRSALQSKKFQDAARQLSLPDIDNMHLAGEESFNEVLQLLWGSRRTSEATSEHISDWLYKNISAKGTTFPPVIHALLREGINSELQNSTQHSLPTLSLLTVPSLQNGLLKASQVYCSEIQRVYPELQPFFNALVGKDRWLSERTLRTMWQDTVQSRMSFSDFVRFLRSIGIFAQADSPREADIYARGFGMRAMEAFS